MLYFWRGKYGIFDLIHNFDRGEGWENKDRKPVKAGWTEASRRKDKNFPAGTCNPSKNLFTRRFYPLMNSTLFDFVEEALVTDIKQLRGLLAIVIGHF